MSFFRDNLFRRELRQTSTGSRQSRYYQCLLVKPHADFSPTNWQERPAEFEIVQELPGSRFLGRADAWRFMHNSATLRSLAGGRVDGLNQFRADELWAIIETVQVDLAVSENSN